MGREQLDILTGTWAPFPDACKQQIIDHARHQPVGFARLFRNLSTLSHSTLHCMCKLHSISRVLRLLVLATAKRENKCPYLDVFEALLLLRLVQQVLEWHVIQHHFQQGRCSQLLCVLFGLGLHMCRYKSHSGIPMPHRPAFRSPGPQPVKS